MSERTYLGDSVYIEQVDYGFRIFCWNGDAQGEKNIIYLEPEVIRALKEYIERAPW